MSPNKNQNRKSNTIALHGGFTEELTGSSAVPIYQTTAYAYPSARELADIFANRAPGYIYTRIANPTTRALEGRLTELEQALGCIATASGMAAISSVTMGLLGTGDEILSATGIFGGTVSLFDKTLRRFGITTVFVDPAEARSFTDALTPRTKMIFVETISNPQLAIADFSPLAQVARQAGIPLVVDNTVLSPALFCPAAVGADIVIHSTSKFINGHGTAIGGAIIDTGRYDWSQGPFPEIRQLAQKAGPHAFLAYLRNVIYRDLGGCPAPMNSFLMLQGLETLHPRMKIHCENAGRLARFLQEHPEVKWVNYPGLESHPQHQRVAQYFGGHAGALLTFGLGDQGAAFRFIDALRLAKNLANLGDAKTLVIHPASTIFHEFTAAQRQEMGVGEDMVRVSVGIEEYEDIENDFAQALQKSFEGAKHAINH